MISGVISFFCDLLNTYDVPLWGGGRGRGDGIDNIYGVVYSCERRIRDTYIQPTPVRSLDGSCARGSPAKGAGWSEELQ